jgi:P4 family phage/plasmid primase-like protien
MSATALRPVVFGHASPVAVNGGAYADSARGTRLDRGASDDRPHGDAADVMLRTARRKGLNKQPKAEPGSAAAQDRLGHHDIACSYIAELAARSGAQPAAAEGQLWVADERGLWLGRTLERIGVEVAERFSNEKLCRRGSDYRQIAQHVLDVAHQPDFFSDAPRGVVCPDGLYLLEGGRVERVDLTPSHRQRFALPTAPSSTGNAPLFRQFLSDAFRSDSPAEQEALAAEIVGAALFGLAPKLQTAALLFGPGGTGKSTLLRVIKKLFPAEFTGAVSPNDWEREYNVAALAGKRMNIVGELSEERQIPASAFKNVTGGDLIGGRHPTHRPFYFVCEAAHIFNSNTLPATTDRSEAFFRRWRVLRFRNVVPAERCDADLADQIIARELGGLLSWAFAGAESVQAAGRNSTTPAHDELMARWRVGSNPVLLFLTDDEWCLLEPKAVSRESAVYEYFRQWASANGHQMMSSTKFYKTLEVTAGARGVLRRRTSDERQIVGVRLLDHPTWKRTR